MTQIVIRHEWAAGARISGDAEKAAQLFAALTERDGAVLLGAVVDSNRDPQAPLHGDYEWDDPTAAQLYRLEQAGHQVRSLRRITVDAHTEEEQPPERVYVPMRVVHTDNGVPSAAATYVPVALAQSEDEQAGRIRAQAVARIERLATEYKAIGACSDIAADLADLAEKYR